jgi:hypothetical protein
MIGLSTLEFNLSKFLGHDSKSFGYNSDGKIFYNGKDKGKEYGSGFKKNDIIGCGINYSKNEIFFTKNGIFLGKAFDNKYLKLYPTVSLHSKGEKIIGNFGRKSFLFDLKSLIDEEEIRNYKEISNIEIDKLKLNILIEKYLYFNGYKESLLSFKDSINNDKGGYDEQFEKRKDLTKFILKGDHKNSIKTFENNFLEFLCDFEEIIILFYSQCLIEAVKNNENDETFSIFQKNLSKYFYRFDKKNDDNLSEFDQFFLVNFL